MRHRLALIVTLLLAFALAAAPAAAAGDSDDQVVVTGSVVVPKGQTVGTIVILDGPVRVDGRVDGDVVALSGRVEVSGVVDGTITSVSERATLTSGARVTGDLFYGDEKPAIASGATVEGKVSDEGWTDLNGPAFGAVVHILMWLAVTLSAAALGVIVWWAAPKTMREASDAACERTGATAAWGAGVFLGLPILALLAISTLVGIPFAVLVLCAMLPLGALGYVTAAWILGDRLVRGKRNWLLTGLTGFGVLRLIALIPFVGFAVSLVATVAGLGALAVVVWQRRTAGGHSQPAGTPTPRPAGQPS